MKRIKTLRFRVTPSEEQRLKKLATEAGFAHYSEYVRTSCFLNHRIKESVDGLETFELGEPNIFQNKDSVFLKKSEVLNILNWHHF